MYEAPVPPDERRRLEVLNALMVLDTPPEARFDLLTTYAAANFRVSVALISLVDRDRQWFKSRRGFEPAETARSVSFCAHAILSDKIMLIRDARADPLFANHPLVIGEPYIRFYAGAPLVMPGGERVGTFCLIDPRPRTLDEKEGAQLRELARVVSLELRGLDASAKFLKDKR